MKKILIVGGSFAEIPIIRAAKELGLHVTTTGYRPLDVGHQYADAFCCADYSDKIAVCRLAEDLNVDAVCSGANDFAMFSAAWTAEHLGLPGHDPYASLVTLMHKDKFHAFARKHGFSCVQGYAFDRADDALAQRDALPYPAIVKPVDMTGGKGVSRVDGPAALPGAIELAQRSSKTPRFLVEELITPDYLFRALYGFITGGGMPFWCSNEEHYYYGNSYLVGGMSLPSVEPPEADAPLRAEFEKMARLLRLKPGILFGQHAIMNGQLKILEMCRRTPGNFHGRMIEKATGFKFSHWTIRAALGESCIEVCQHAPRECWGVVCVFAKSPGRIKRVIFSPEAEHWTQERMWLLHVGEMVEDARADKVGVLMLRFDTIREMAENMPHLPEHIIVETEL